MSSEPLHSLKLEDDDIDFLTELEEQFCIQISDQESQKIFTVGQLYDLIVNKIGDVGGTKCASMMAFYKLRAAVYQLDIDTTLRPTTAIGDLAETPPKEFHKQIQARCNLRVPAPDLGRSGDIGMLLCLAATVAVFPMILIISNLMLVLGIVFGLFLLGGLLVKFDKGIWNENQQTLGDLARQMTYSNFGVLAARGAISDKNKIWLGLMSTINDFIDFGENTNICRSTRLL